MFFQVRRVLRDLTSLKKISVKCTHRLVESLLVEGDNWSNPKPDEDLPLYAAGYTYYRAVVEAFPNHLAVCV